jgi:hypothetical protein
VLLCSGHPTGRLISRGRTTSRAESRPPQALGPPGRRTFDFSRQSVAVNHYYFYLRDPDWGPTSIEAISRDGRRPLISRRDCAMDCKDVRVEYFELTLP